ncbi:hypothetical protein, partial [Burkholderia cenocepacia]
MRQLVIVCARGNVPAVQEGLSRFGHPAAVAQFVSVVPVDTAVDVHSHQLRQQVYGLLTGHPASNKAIGEPLVCVTKEIGAALGLKVLQEMTSLQGETTTAKTLCALQNSKGVPYIARLLNQCDLSLRHASAAFLSEWNHFAIGRQHVLNWLAQFGALGRLTWIGEAILRHLTVIEANDLGDLFAGLCQQEHGALCVNRDARRHGKSGDTIATLITKRSGQIVHESPATAIDTHGERRVVLFEDGLWSGTEAMGVIESLQGKRPGREKTRALADANVLDDVELTFAYGVATDYGKAVVERFIEEQKLQGRFKVVAGKTVPVASAALLEGVRNGRLALSGVRDVGPPQDQLRPFIGAAFANDPVLSEAQREEAYRFCGIIGYQLFNSYLAGMQRKEGDRLAATHFPIKIKSLVEI